MAQGASLFLFVTQASGSAAALPLQPLCSAKTWLQLSLHALQVAHRFYQQFTGMPLERVEEETDRDNFMGGQKAIELGLIDSVL